MLASRIERYFAQVIDGLLYLGVYVFIIMFKASYLLLGAGIMLVFAAQLWLLSTVGQTIGKRLLGIRIVNYKDGSVGGFYTNVFLRVGVVTLLACIPKTYGLLSIIDSLFIFREDHRCLHDHIAGTKVMKVPVTAVQPELISSPPPPPSAPV